MNKKSVIKKTAAHIKKEFSRDATGHDWWHIHRVRNLALRIGKKEKADLFIVELGALLHDIADYKFHDGDDTAGGKAAALWLHSLKVDEETIAQVIHIVDNVSFGKGVGKKSAMRSLEGKVVQDADRLDAIGAMGIARVFAYAGAKGRPIHDPRLKPVDHKNFESYKKGSQSAINHFYEKLFHLEQLMNTKTGKALAKKRHQFMKSYLNTFLAEWEARQ